MIIPELAIGGAQRSFAQLALDLSDKYEVEIVVFDGVISGAYPLSIPIHSLDVQAGRGIFWKSLKFFKRIYRLRKLKLTQNPAVSISFLEGADYINVLSSIGERIILSIRGSKQFDMEIKGVLGWIRRRLLIPTMYRRASKVITVSRHLLSEMNKSYGIPLKKLQTIYNYYDIDKLVGKTQEALPPEFKSWPADVLINVGRLHPGKNQKFLIEIFPKILSRCPDAKLVIIGDGSYRNDLLQMARATGINTFSIWHDSFTNDYGIYFLGEQSNPLPFMNKSKVFLLPSFYEGFPNVLIEAMVSGVPIISADCNYGPSEILLDNLGNKYGVLLPIDLRLKGLSDIWINEIVKQLHCNHLNVHSKKGIGRANDFSRARILDLWIENIEKV